MYRMNKMIKMLATTLLLSGSAALSFAQNAHEGRVKFMKGDQNAIIADYDLPREVVEDALKERLEKSGLGKKSTEKGFMAYKGKVWSEISPDKVDVYAKVEGKSDKSTITMLVSKGYDNFISSASDADNVQKVQAFLNSFLRDAKAYQLRLAIAAQEEIVKKAEKDYKGSTDDGEKLVRDKEKIEKQIVENKNDQDKKQGVLSVEKKKLEDLKAQIL